ncbi:MAG TPA: OmpA family protein, partial [Chitinophagaceae bacterium]|nr:OmpA family protein [Chitinophagaceae bacterium]
MRKLLNNGLVLITVVIMASCGTNKKLATANDKINDLNSQLTTANSKLAENDKLIGQLKEENISYSKEAQDCRIAKENVTRKLEKLENDLERESKAIDSVAERAELAVQKLVDAGAEVTMGDGLVYVSMPDKFLFKSGSATVGVKGKEGLAVIAEILQEYPNTEAIVVGNTDSAHVKGKADNWSLSTERANAVVRILRDTYQIDPIRLTAAGRGKYNPVAPNNSAEGREKNRRIEIILIPDLSGLWEML